MAKELDNNKSKVPEEKHPGGRPALFKTPEDLQAKIDEYFDIVKQEKLEDPTRTPGIAELAYHLGFDSRQSLYDQEKRNDEFSYITKRARLRCCVAAEKDLAADKGNPTKHIYKLNAMNYHKDNVGSKSSRIGGNVIIITTDKKPEGLNIDGQEILPDEC